MPDRRWKTTAIVPVVVALIGAIGGVAAAVIPSILAPHGVAEQAPRAYSGTIVLRNGNREIDLDSSSSDGTGGDHIPDLIHENRALTTSPSALIVLLDRAQQPTPGICRSALGANGTHSITISQLETGRSLCVRTSAGRLGAITLVQVNKYFQKYSGVEELGRVTLSYRIWDVPST